MARVGCGIVYNVGMKRKNHALLLTNFEACTGCGDEAFAIVLGNCDPADKYNGPYALCEDAYKEWLIIGDHILDIHD